MCDVDNCDSCGNELPENECPNPKRPCGHHCNCSWVHDKCCWCGDTFGEESEIANRNAGDMKLVKKISPPVSNHDHDRILVTVHMQVERDAAEKEIRLLRDKLLKVHAAGSRFMDFMEHPLKCYNDGKHDCVCGREEAITKWIEVNQSDE